ncbi:MAG: hypothetical protein OXU69_15805 [Gemmatimonadota bacterium]|nr:hypothetical protein [Gemmatimonadota bacterium]MDE2986167.1 hypothetical protein [Gemmatimonadota bacterium]
MMSKASRMSGAGSLVVGAGCALVVLGAANSPSPSPQELPVIDLPTAEAVFRGKQFSWIQSVRELSDGRLVVSDPIERSLYVLDFRSDAVSSIGTIGDGPGEYQWPGHLYALGGDSTLFVDGAAHKWFLMVGDRIVQNLDSRTGAAAPILHRIGSAFLGTDQSGRVLGVEGFAHKPGAPTYSTTQADSVRFLLSGGGVLGSNSSAGTDGNRFDTIAELGGQGLAGVLVEQGLTPYQRISQLATDGQAWLFRDGWIAVAHPEPYRVDWRRPDGQWIRGAPLPFTPVEVTHEESASGCPGSPCTRSVGWTNSPWLGRSTYLRS